MQVITEAEIMRLKALLDKKETNRLVKNEETTAKKKTRKMKRREE